MRRQVSVQFFSTKRAIMRPCCVVYSVHNYRNDAMVLEIVDTVSRIFFYVHFFWLGFPNAPACQTSVGKWVVAHYMCTEKKFLFISTT